ncbi:hypothetical protein HDU92_008782 [Lobulomyces angularis]|nr:hypothetical protein HDU92_008782 [Lobulomyces angularis]
MFLEIYQCSNVIIRCLRPSEEEQKCIDKYDRSPIFYGLLNIAFWGFVSYKTLEFPALVIQKAKKNKKNLKVQNTLIQPGRPMWLNLFGVVAISAGAFSTVFYSSKMASRSCLQCFLDTKDKKSELYNAVRKNLKEYHPNHQKMFDKEKWRLLHKEDAEKEGK